MAINNEIHIIGFKRKFARIYGEKYTCDNNVIQLDTELYTADKTHDLIIL